MSDVATHLVVGLLLSAFHIHPPSSNPASFCLGFPLHLFPTFFLRSPILAVILSFIWALISDVTRIVRLGGLKPGAWSMVSQALRGWGKYQRRKLWNHGLEVEVYIEAYTNE